VVLLSIYLLEYIIISNEHSRGGWWKVGQTVVVEDWNIRKRLQYLKVQVVHEH